MCFSIQFQWSRRQWVNMTEVSSRSPNGAVDLKAVWWGERESILEPSFNKPRKMGKNLQVVRETPRGRLLICQDMDGCCCGGVPGLLLTRGEGQLGFCEELAGREVSRTVPPDRQGNWCGACFSLCFFDFPFPLVSFCAWIWVVMPFCFV